MPRIYASLAVIIGSGVLIAAGSTGAFFSDTEGSTGNTFAAGTIDLKIDNESYVTNPDGVFAVSSSTSWALSDLTEGLLFFNFTDIKPSDKGEDTISLHVNNNDSYACLDMSLTSNDDVSSNEPELGDGDVQEDLNNTWDGELAQNLTMFWWADDGDNVYEQGEPSITPQVETVEQMFDGGNVFSVPLADTVHNVWTGTSSPLAGDTTYYIGKAWCFGVLSQAALAQDGQGHTEGATNGPLVRGMGFTCNGQGLNNETQTDGLTMDIAFRAVQARNNPGFVCNNNNPRLAEITVIKHVSNIHGGNKVVADFHLFVDDGNVATAVTSSVTTTVAPGTYAVEETGSPGYTPSFSGDCDAFGNVTLAPGDNKVCDLTNTDLPANITLIKNVTGPIGVPLAQPTQFGLSIDGNLAQNNTSYAVTSNVSHTISEAGRTGYHFVSITGSPQCPAVLGGTATLSEGQAITCTITNAKNMGPVI